VAGLLTLHASWLAPYFVPDHRAATKPFTLLSLNTYAGAAVRKHFSTGAAGRRRDLAGGDTGHGPLAVLGLGTRFMPSGIEARRQQHRDPLGFR
jgi:hypothetical protein